MEFTEESIKKILIQSGLWLFLSVAVAIFAALLPLYPSSETQGEWFQRSGSIVVLIAVWVEFKLLPLSGFFDKNSYSAPFDLPSSFNTSHKYISILTIFIVISGTFIWGYGDLLL
jgi:hypothetical protein